MALHGRETHTQEIELQVGAPPDDLEVVLERRIGVGVTDDHARGVQPLLLEDTELLEADRRHDGMGGDGQAGPPGRPRGSAVDALLERRNPRLVRPYLADDSR